MRPHLHTNEAGWGGAYANIRFDCNTRQNVVVCRASEWFSLKYRLQADSVHLASDRTEAVFLSSVTHLHCYACLASACLARVFVLMWTRLNVSLKLFQPHPSWRTLVCVEYTKQCLCEQLYLLDKLSYNDAHAFFRRVFNYSKRLGTCEVRRWRCKLVLRTATEFWDNLNIYFFKFLFAKPIPPSMSNIIP